jgi:hypothetical protein
MLPILRAPYITHIAGHFLSVRSSHKIKTTHRLVHASVLEGSSAVKQVIQYAKLIHKSHNMDHEASLNFMYWCFHGVHYAMTLGFTSTDMSGMQKIPR